MKEHILAKLTRAEAARIFDDLSALVAIEGTSGDEGRVVAAVADRIASLPGIQSQRLQDNLIVWQGQPRVALFAHLDTVGFTLGYDRELVRIGGPHVTGGEAVRSPVGGVTHRGRVARRGDNWVLDGAPDAPEGTRWVYDTPLVLDGNRIRGPYLDNRAGV